uniref:Uncharacterized protein n=1 Tax=Oreochromis niloticus TaxID=8128 RepID=A0A669F4R3_ORENI
LLLFLSKPSITIPIALNLIEKFGQVSGYKLNLFKSVLFPINDKVQQTTWNISPFNKNCFNYLGVCVTYDYNCYYTCSKPYQSLFLKCF